MSRSKGDNDGWLLYNIVDKVVVVVGFLLSKPFNDSQDGVSIRNQELVTEKHVLGSIWW